MARYILFGGDEYYPTGGCHDVTALSDDLDELVETGLEKHGDEDSWWHILDLESMKVVRGGGHAYGQPYSYDSESFVIPRVRD